MPTIDFIEEQKVMAMECAAKAQSLLDASLAALCERTRRDSSGHP